ncbi:MAG TPA: AarF/ABC1/UbiB kinase family protein [Terracidiphilus sp.]|nr:AarF/ABC1/UbiB kinase family protein [Terracidiphilus sp.]
MLFGRRQPDPDRIEELGLFAVKISQVLALRPDFLEEAKCRTLAGLYSRQRPVQREQLDRLLDGVGGARFLASFDRFDRVPLAVASVGQVHRARLRSGEEVAVKLVKQDDRNAFERDIARARLILNVAHVLYPRLRGVANPLSLINQLSALTLNELDLRNEARGHDLLESVYRTRRNEFDLSRLRFACIHRELSGERVLVKDFVPGRSFDELMNAGQLTYQSLLDLFHIHGFYMFVEGTFHGDLHPGNVIRRGNALYFIDTGFIGRVSERIRVNLFRFFDSLSSYDYGASAMHLHAMSSAALGSGEYAAFERKFLALYADFRERPVGDVSLTKKMMETIRLGVLSGMEFEEGMFDIVKSLMYMDGMVLRVHPRAVLLKDLRPFIEEFKAQVA